MRYQRIEHGSRRPRGLYSTPLLKFLAQEAKRLSSLAGFGRLRGWSCGAALHRSLALLGLRAGRACLQA
jgi:hypothetical protein